MNYLPPIGSLIFLDDGKFKVEEIFLSTFGAVVHLGGNFIKLT